MQFLTDIFKRKGLEPIKKITEKDCQFDLSLNDLSEEEKENLIKIRIKYKIQKNGWW